MLHYIEYVLTHSFPRAFHYFINSIQEPELFPSYECSSVEQCLQARSFFDKEDSRDSRLPPDTYMGEAAIVSTLFLSVKMDYRKVKHEMLINLILQKTKRFMCNF